MIRSMAECSCDSKSFTDPTTLRFISRGSSMNPLSNRSARFVGVALIVASLPITIAGQDHSGSVAVPLARSSAAHPFAKRTPWGHPDLQGLWTNTTTTPFERPARMANRRR
jgi:hypothetical protein